MARCDMSYTNLDYFFHCGVGRKRMDKNGLEMCCVSSPCEVLRQREGGWEMISQPVGDDWLERLDPKGLVYKLVSTESAKKNIR